MNVQQLIEAVKANTGRSDLDSITVLENTVAKINQSLFVAISNHQFSELRTESRIDLTAGITSYDIEDVDEIENIYFDINTTTYQVQSIDKSMFDKRFLSVSDEAPGVPFFVSVVDNTIYFDRPLQADVTLCLTSISEATVLSTDLTAELPIQKLVPFLIDYVTALVFLSLENVPMYTAWDKRAMGSGYQSAQNSLGGSLLTAIRKDKTNKTVQHSLLGLNNNMLREAWSVWDIDAASFKNYPPPIIRR